MPKIMQVLFVLDVIALIYVFLRSPWLFRVRNEYRQKAYEMFASRRGEPKTQEEMNELSKYADPYYEAIWGLPSSLFCFWKWNLGGMVRNREKFEEVMKYAAEDRLCTQSKE